MIRVYVGRRHLNMKACVVSLYDADDDGTRTSAIFCLDRQLALRIHTDRFEWGDHGKGASQLALAIVRDHLAHEDAERVCFLHLEATGELFPRTAAAITPALDQLALRLHQAFKRDHVAAFPHEQWRLTTADVSAWLARQHLTQRTETDNVEA